jgi:hypothetical protein
MQFTKQAQEHKYSQRHNLKQKIKDKDIYTGCPGGNVPDFGRMFPTLKYTDITQYTYIRS